MAIRERRQVLRSLFVPGSRKFWSLRNEISRTLFLALVAGADDEGRLEGEPEDVKSIVPRSKWTVAEIKKCLKELEKSTLIEWYQVGENRYIQLKDFAESQSWHGVMKDASKFPAPPSVKTATINDGGRSDGRSSPTATLSRVGFIQDKDNTPTEQKQTPTTQPRSKAQGGLDAGETFKLANRQFRRKVGKSIGSLKPRFGQWNSLVEKHGSAVVIEAVKIWATEKGKFLRTLGYPLAFFVKEPTEWIEAAQDSRDDAEDETPSAIECATVEFEGRQVPEFVRDQILAERANGKKRIEEKEREENAGRENIERIQQEGF